MKEPRGQEVQPGEARERAEAFAKIKGFADEGRSRGWVRLTVPRRRAPEGRTVRVMPGVVGELLCVNERPDRSVVAVVLVRVDALDRWLGSHAAWREG